MKTGARMILGVVSLLVASVLSVLPSAQSATTGYTTLCWGYVGCADRGMGNDGYRTAGGTMYWRMYSGHNCTNYAAYRMVRSGMPNVRPWSGGGNAEFWGTSNPGITDQTPTVGSVAWWRAGAPPAGSSGHVGYVEQVVSSTEIIVSMDSWGGDFSWARITKASGRWPSGFVHFNDVRLSNTAAPTISGRARVGSTLTTTAATFSPSGAAVTYQWRADGVDIAGATGQSLLLAERHEGQRISVRATATKAGYPASHASSALTDPVEQVTLAPTAAPAIRGTVRVGETLTASPASFSPAGATITYRWLADGVAIPEGTGASLLLRPAHRDQRISVRATATQAGYTGATSVSAATAPVAPGLLASLTGPAVAGTAAVGQTLTADPGTWNPVPTRLLYQWTADGQAIAGATTGTFAPGPELVGKAVGLTVTARKYGYSPVVLQAVPTARVVAGTFDTSTLPALTGSPRLGQTLSLDPGSYTPEGDVAVHWRRNGAVVPGATGTSYQLAPADLGSTIAATVTVARPGFTTLIAALPPTGAVKSPAAMTVGLRQGRYRLRLEVAVSAPSVVPVTGEVAVRQGGRLVGQGTLTGGDVSVPMAEIRSGSRLFTIRFRGSPTVTALTEQRQLLVP